MVQASVVLSFVILVTAVERRYFLLFVESTRNRDSSLAERRILVERLGVRIQVGEVGEFSSPELVSVDTVSASPCVTAVVR